MGKLRVCAQMKLQPLIYPMPLRVTGPFLLPSYGRRRLLIDLEGLFDFGTEVNQHGVCE